ncbi:uncharacterized protein LOC113316933 isoform X1 [Papaver somniferum]|uniref:uncharacterized protein LOC113316933 isoform X1 n=1 Tax=Papaver somniferum TaxID=3469 RepID=UPI000E701479|nr:uncharacterized protein LOC113316933 isoform X1 [Papaver somniferum]
MTTKEDSFQAILPDYFLDAEYAFEGNKDMTTIPDEEATSGGNSRDITSEQEIFQVPLQIPSDDEYASSISYYNSEEEYSDEDEDEDVDVDVCGGSTKFSYSPCINFSVSLFLPVLYLDDMNKNKDVLQEDYHNNDCQLGLYGCFTTGQRFSSQASPPSKSGSWIGERKTRQQKLLG